MTSISGMTVFITGAASGLGLEMARSFAARGANVMMSDINGEALEREAAKLLQSHNTIAAVQCDVAEYESMQKAADATVAHFGKVHMVINNAGVGSGGKTGAIPIKDWQWVVDINLMGVVHGVEIFTPLMLSHGEGGHIVNVASMAGHVAMPGMGPYHATKFAVVGYSESLLAELPEQGIGVSVLCPAWVKTQIHKSGFGAPSKAGKPIDMSDPMSQQMTHVIENGMPPELVSEWVADCVEADRFYIFTHPDFYGPIAARHERIASDYKAAIDDPRFAAYKKPS